MASLTEEDTKTSSVCDVISNFPGFPSFKFSTVPPTYETSPSSTASKGRAKSKTRQSVASLFITVPSPNRSKLRVHHKKAFSTLHLDCRCLSEEALCFASRPECALKRKCRGGQTPTHLPSNLSEQLHGSRAYYSSRLSFDSALFKHTNEIYHAATIGARCFDVNASASLRSSDV